MLQKNNRAFSIALAMMLVIIMLLVAYNLLDFLIPFSKNTKGIENASNAYYQSYGRVEKSINFIAKNPIGSSTGTSMSTNSIGYSISMDSSGITIPKAGNGNSEFDTAWNRIGPGEPVQLYVKNGIDWNTNTKLYFRVPDINGLGAGILSGGTGGIINWQISGSGYTLNSSGSQINASEINGNAINLGGKDGIDLDGSGLTFSTAYGDLNKLNNCNNTCSLKLSIINTLATTTGTQIPYLEYKIVFNTTVPQQYVDITSEGKSYGFKKTINTKYRVDTTSEAFDFTVFQ